MSLPEIEWLVSADMRHQIEPHLLAALRYCPPWMLTLTVRYEPHEGDLLSTSVLPEYRTASIVVGSGWFSDTDIEKRVSFVHEILHQYVETLAVVFRDLLGAMEPDKAMKTWAGEQWRRAEEAMICDLSRSLLDA